MPVTSIATSFKLGVKREIVGALQKAFGPTYPDPEFAGRVKVVAEYPIEEVSYPMVVMKFNPGTIKDSGLGNVEYAQADDGSLTRVKRWLFDGSIQLEVYALTPEDRDLVILGLLNMFAFGDEIVAFANFWKEIRDYDYVTMQINTSHIEEGGDSIVSVPWSDDETPVFTDSISLQVLGEFYTEPTTGGLVQISQVPIYPYLPGVAVPTGSTEVIGSPGQPGYENDNAVPWTPSVDIL